MYVGQPKTSQRREGLDLELELQAINEPVPILLNEAYRHWPFFT